MIRSHFKQTPEQI